ncbi:60s ribosomal protein l25 [Diplodia corticola]|uniref:60s ribosomal protein l25 n=1 Tax=Diplodia corticola TaxID=236234 RepID=A0A1J9QWA7_9PEZI|nr:60s ribosomal protein l25 [Diplodia corticola]OJD32712.1 60s ribosomal protein l25 [Diplodia corticola]
MASTKQHINLAKSLHPRLMRFFQKFPPPSLLQGTAAASSTPTAAAPTESTAAAEQQQPAYHNPFQPRFNTITGRWQGPAFSLRRQADLCKLAAKHGVEELLPYSKKKSGERARRREEQGGLRVKGTGVGQKVKGKLWERGLKGKLEERRQAMLQMPEMIQTWKQRGHGRGWKKWPK